MKIQSTTYFEKKGYEMMKKRTLLRIMSTLLILLTCSSAFHLSIFAHEKVSNVIKDTDSTHLTSSNNSTMQEYTCYSQTSAQEIDTVTRGNPHGVYAIRKANTNIYAKSTSVSSLAWIYQETLTAPPTSTGASREYLFKITYRATTDDYIIRSMVNNEMFMFPSILNNAPLANRIIVSGASATDVNLSTGYTWKMTATTDGFYQIWYETEGVKYYVRSASDSGGTTHLVFTTNSADTGTKWAFSQYTGDAIDGIGYTGFRKELIPSETYTLQAYMFSSTIGRNGPVLFDSDNENILTVGYTTGLITAIAPGTTKIFMTYLNSPWRWNSTATVEKSLVGTYHFGNLLTGRLLTENTELEQWKYELQKKQIWELIYDSNGFYKIKNTVTGNYLTSPVSNVSGEKITSQSLITGTDVGVQRWNFTKQTDGSYQIKANNRSTYVVSVDTTSSNANGIKITQRPPDSGDRTKWNLASSTYFTPYGQGTRAITIQRIGSGANSANDGGIWQNAITNAVNAWNTAGAGVNITLTTSTSVNTIKVAPLSEGWYGLTYFRYSPTTGYFSSSEITLNSSLLPNGTTTSDSNSRKTTAVHEIGHLLFLEDDPCRDSPNASVMNGNKNRDVIHVPQAFDIKNVLFRYESIE